MQNANLNNFDPNARIAIRQFEDWQRKIFAKNANIGVFGCKKRRFPDRSLLEKVCFCGKSQKTELCRANPFHFAFLPP